MEKQREKLIYSATPAYAIEKNRFTSIDFG